MPQAGTFGVSAKPLNLRGASPPLKELSFAHCAPQNVTELAVPEFLSPMTKLPPPGANEKSTVLHDVAAVLAPTPVMLVVMVKTPVVAYVCDPLTVYGPPLAPVTVPADVARSPQLMVAEKSAGVPN